MRANVTRVDTLDPWRVLDPVNVGAPPSFVSQWSLAHPVWVPALHRGLGVFVDVLLLQRSTHASGAARSHARSESQVQIVWVARPWQNHYHNRVDAAVIPYLS